MKAFTQTLALVGSLSALSACGLKIDSEKTTPEPTKTYESFSSYNGQFTGRATALSQGLETICTLDAEIVQSDSRFELRRLEYECQDGTSWGFDKPMVFELRAPTNPTHLAYDLHYDGAVVGFLNYSNSAAYTEITQVGTKMTLGLSQNKSGVVVEGLQIRTNGWTLFNAYSARVVQKPRF